MVSTQALRVANRRPVSGEYPSPPGTTLGGGNWPDAEPAVLRRWVRSLGLSSRHHDTGEMTRLPSRPGEFHPESLTEPDLILSHHPARAITRRLPPSAEYSILRHLPQ